MYRLSSRRQDIYYTWSYQLFLEDLRSSRGSEQNRVHNAFRSIWVPTSKFWFVQRTRHVSTCTGFTLSRYKWKVSSLHRWCHHLLLVRQRSHSPRGWNPHLVRKSWNISEMAKVWIFHDSIKYLGYTLRTVQLEINDIMTKILRGASSLKTVTKVRSLLGAANVYRCFVKYFSKISSPL